MRRAGVRTWAAIGGNDALLIACDAELDLQDGHDLMCDLSVRPGERVRLVIRYQRPELLDTGPIGPHDPARVDDRLDTTVHWWRRWLRGYTFDGDAPRAINTVREISQELPYGRSSAALPDRCGGRRRAEPTELRTLPGLHVLAR